MKKKTTPARGPIPYHLSARFMINTWDPQDNAGYLGSCIESLARDVLEEDRRGYTYPLGGHTHD